jgi:hypothetical protein
MKQRALVALGVAASGTLLMGSAVAASQPSSIAPPFTRSTAAVPVSLSGTLPAEAGQTGSSDHPVGPPAAGPRNEPAVAVNPLNAAQVVVAANDFNYQSSRAFSNVAVHPSRDGGRSFPVAIELPTPQGTQQSVDPGLAFDRDGHLYASYVASPYGAFVARSDDGGLSWHWPRRAAAFTSCSQPDYPSIATTGTTVYLVWQQIPRPSCAGTPRLLISMSFDTGRTWSTPRPLPTEPGAVSLAPRLAAGPTRGSLAISYLAVELSQPPTNCPPDAAFDVMVDTSTDGTHFHRAVLARSVCGPMSVDTNHDSNQYHDTEIAPFDPPYGGAGGVPAPAFDPRTGVIVAAAAYSDATQTVSTHFYASTDHGRHWHSTGIIRTLGSQPVMPYLAAGADGSMCLNWIAQRPGPVHQAMAAVSHDDGAAWSAPQQLSSQPSYGDFGAVGNWLGDYIGDAIGPDGIAHPAWTDTRSYPAQPNGPYQEIWTRSIRA